MISSEIFGFFLRNHRNPLRVFFSVVLPKIHLVILQKFQLKLFHRILPEMLQKSVLKLFQGFHQRFLSALPPRFHQGFFLPCFLGLLTKVFQEFLISPSPWNLPLLVIIREIPPKIFPEILRWVLSGISSRISLGNPSEISPGMPSGDPSEIFQGSLLQLMQRFLPRFLQGFFLEFLPKFIPSFSNDFSNFSGVLFGFFQRFLLPSGNSLWGNFFQDSFRRFPEIATGIHPDLFWEFSLEFSLKSENSSGFPQEISYKFSASFLHEITFIQILWVSFKDFFQNSSRRSARIFFLRIQSKPLRDSPSNYSRKSSRIFCRNF